MESIQKSSDQTQKSFELKILTKSGRWRVAPWSMDASLCDFSSRKSLASSFPLDHGSPLKVKSNLNWQKSFGLKRLTESGKWRAAPWSMDVSLCDFSSRKSLASPFSLDHGSPLKVKSNLNWQKSFQLKRLTESGKWRAAPWSMDVSLCDFSSRKSLASPFSLDHGSPLKVKSNLNWQKSFGLKRLTESGNWRAAPWSMDVSLCDFSSRMSLASPCSLDHGSISCTAWESPLVLPEPRENILIKKEKEFWDVPEYADDIFQYLQEAEQCHRPMQNYMAKQTDITASMRWILVDWLVEVVGVYEFQTETLHLAVSYIDRFLSHMSVKRDNLQLVGTTAMFIAAKYEEIKPPGLSQFAYLTNNYRISQILHMEQLILKVLDFDMTVPSAYLFIMYYASIIKCDEVTKHLAMFLCELSLLDSDPFLRYLPSKIAAAALALSNFTLGKETWSNKLMTGTRYCLDDLRECYVDLHRAFVRAAEPTQHAIRTKYKSAELQGVSMLLPKEYFPW